MEEVLKYMKTNNWTKLVPR